jgi:hypothetical protein
MTAGKLAGALVAYLAVQPAVAQVNFLTADQSNATFGVFQTGNPGTGSGPSVELLEGSGYYRNYFSVYYVPAATAMYTFGQTQSPVDTAVILYSGRFDPANPLTNALDLNDDTMRGYHRDAIGDQNATVSCRGNNSQCPQLKADLEAGKKYAIVFANNSGRELANIGNLTSFGLTEVFYVIGPGSLFFLSSLNTYFQLRTLSAADRNQLIAREAVLTSSLGYDSNEFGKNNISVSFVGRYTGLSDSTGEGAGALVAAYRVHPNVRIGAFVDYAVRRDTPTGIKHGDTEPTVGGFAVYEQNKDLTGINARVAVAYNHGGMTVTRSGDVDLGTESGSGKAGMKSFALSAEAGFGVRIAPTVVAVPYLGIRYTDVTRKGYSETETAYVIAPLTYNDYGQRLTTALGGVRFHGKFDEKISAFVGLGAEYDVDREMDAYSGTSSITGLETFSVSTNSHPNRLRASASAGVGYQVAANRSISAQVAVRQQAYSADPAITSMVKYSMGF